MGMDRTSSFIPIATRGKLNLNEDIGEKEPTAHIIHQEKYVVLFYKMVYFWRVFNFLFYHSRREIEKHPHFFKFYSRPSEFESQNEQHPDEVHAIFEFGPKTPNSVTVFPNDRHIEQHVMSNTIFLKLKGGHVLQKKTVNLYFFRQVFNARVETTTKESRGETSRPFFRPIESSQTRHRVGSISVGTQLHINEDLRGSSMRNGHESHKTPVPKPVLIRNRGQQQIHGKILN